MRKDKKWLGLFTHASPYSLPDGANQEQVNVHCRRQGELRCRRGMQKLSQSTGATVPEIRDVFSLHGTLGTQMLFLMPSGQLGISGPLESSAGPASGLVPRLSTSSGTTETSYLWQYQDNGGATNDLVRVFYGGSAEQQSWQYSLRPDQQCVTAGGVVSGGSAEDVSVSGIPEQELCSDASN